MGILIHGTQKTAINVDEFLVRCPSCEAHNVADVMVSSLYFHLYWIPMFPYDKEATVICQKCGLQRNGLSFDSKLLSNYEEVKSKFKHPFFTYIGAAVFASIILLSILSRLF